ncbi:MAG: acetyl-coenzyme A synthetase N-terminal domain-containing protein, partial [Pseudomonadota bacterium]
MTDQAPIQTALVPVPEHVSATAHVTAESYARDYTASLSDPDGFWGEVGRRLDWIEPFSEVRDASFGFEDVHIRWFGDGVLNVAANCVDRHLEARGDQTAILFEPDDPSEAAQAITYRDLHASVCRMANILKASGVEKGDRVVIYLPMIPEAA